MIKEIFSIDDVVLGKINKIRKDISEQLHSVINKDDYKLDTLEDENVFLYEINELIGYLTLGKESASSPDNEIHMNLFVSPKYQNKGIGTEFIEKAKEVAASKQNIDRITIMVKKKNKGSWINPLLVDLSFSTA